MRRWSVKIVLGLVSIFAVVACSNGTNSDSGFDTPNPQTAALNWSPDQTTYKCNAKNCPDNQGLLFSVSRTEKDDGFYKTEMLSIYRCTATLYAPNRIMTAGHCVDKVKTSDHSYFRTLERPGHPSRTIPVTKVLVDHRDASDLWVADYGALELASSVDGVTYAHPAAVLPSDVEHLIALVSNGATQDSKTDFVLDAVNCENTRKAMLFPLTLEENPTTYPVYNCKIYSGNSGGVVVSPEDLVSVVGIVQTSDNAKKSDDGGPSDLEPINNSVVSRPPVDFGGVANARCFQLPGWPQVQPNCVEITDSVRSDLDKQILASHFEKFNKSKMEELSHSAAYRQVQAGSVAIHLAPEVVMTSTSSWNPMDSSSKQPGLGFVPAPICFTGSLQKLRPLLPLMLENYSTHANSDYTGVRFVHEIPLALDVEARKLDPNHLALTYIFPAVSQTGDQFKVTALDNSQSAMVAGDPVTIGRCGHSPGRRDIQTFVAHNLSLPH